MRGLFSGVPSYRKTILCFTNSIIVESTLCQQPAEILIFRTFFVKFSILEYMFYWKSATSIKEGHVYDFTVTYVHWMFVLILICMERGDPWLYYGTNYMYLGVQFSSS